jgi:hypothetical protein
VGEKIFGLPTHDITSTLAYTTTSDWDLQDLNNVTICRVLAYAITTWQKHINALRSFIKFCTKKRVSLFKCDSLMINLFLIHEAQQAKTFGTIESFFDAYAFLAKIFRMENVTKDSVVEDVKKFVSKITVHKSNKKLSFGFKEVKILWNGMTKMYGELETWSKLNVRTFMLAIFQHKTFCRFSDVQKIKIDDVMFCNGYFKILISHSKTDQSGKGDYVFLAKNENCNMDAHLLFCKYIQIMGFNEIDAKNLYLFPPLKWNKTRLEWDIVPEKSVSYSVALRYFKSMLKSVHLDPAMFGLHSPRIGATTDAFFQGVPDHVIDQQGRWKSSNSKYSYLRKNEDNLIHHIKKYSRY